MKNQLFKILFIWVFISGSSALSNAQILFNSPKEWANSVPQSVIDASNGEND